VILIQNAKHKLISLAISLAAALIPTSVPTAATAAERITFNVTPFGQFQVKVKDLEAFVARGSRTDELNYYLDRLTPEQLAKLPKLLSTPLEFKPLTIAKFSNSAVGAIAIKNFGKGIRSEKGNGFYALRGAMIAAAFDKEGLTILNLLHHYPLETIHLDLGVLNQYLERGTKLAANREIIDRTWFAHHQPQLLKKQILKAQTKQPVDLAMPGQYAWQKRTLTYKNPHRQETGLFDLYQPKYPPKGDGMNSTPSDRPLPVIAISHGMASSRQTFAYLAKHLASHGFAVAVIEHDDMSLAKFDRVLAGTESFPEANNLIDQPLDISVVLDRLEVEANLNLEQVGLVGQSFGGYSALALAGGTLIPETKPGECQSDSYSDVLLDLSSLAKCTFNQQYQAPVKLLDSRVKAVIAINPMAKVFGSAGMSQIQTPTMIISGSNDLIMPPVAEQIKPFSWLNDNLEKYLVLVKPATHFSFLQEGLGVLPVPDKVVGPRPIYAYPALKTLSTAFFQSYLAQQSEYQTYLQSDFPPGTLKDLLRDRTSQLNNHAFKFSILRHIDEKALEQFED
jgi:predicted dienelactone hydrolase